MAQSGFEKYEHFSVEDFIGDSQFIHLVKYEMPIDSTAWNLWIAGREDKQKLFDEAYHAVKILLSAKRLYPSEGSSETLWNDILNNVNSVEKKKLHYRVIRMSLTAVAACLLVVIGSYLYLTSKISINTGYGEQLAVTLPDGSAVTLNSNSSISYYRTWKLTGRREVWLDGEAFFDVKHLNKDTGNISPNERFIVHADYVYVEVLGTRFNIKKRNGKIIVTLMSGKVQVANVNDKRHRVTIMFPNDVAKFSSVGAFLPDISKTVKETNQPAAWLDRQIKARDMTVQDIIDNYEQTFGYHIILEDTSMANKKIDGTMSLGNENDILYMLANILNANIEKNGKNIYLRPK
jgi:Fe2+-dicitrate sensor, membrane component